MDDRVMFSPSSPAVMKEVWANDPLKIQEEMRELIETQTPVFISRDDFAPQILTAQDMEAKNNLLLIRLDKEQPFHAPHDLCFFFYRPAEFVTRGFFGTPVDQTPAGLSLLVPHEIVQIQRRRHPRLETPENSTVVFTAGAVGMGEKGRVVDISLGGALLQGPFVSQLATGAAIESLEFLLCMQNPRLAPVEVRVPMASVVRMMDAGGGTKKLAIQFAQSDKLNTDLENYLDLRLMETRFLAR